MKHKTWLEVALNGTGGRAHQHLMPISVKDLITEGITCIKAGASIIHFHAYDKFTEHQKDTTDLYVQVIEGIRAKVDAIIYGSLPMIGTQNIKTAEDLKKRYSVMENLATRGLLEWMVVDPGTVNISAQSRLVQDKNGFTYSNPDNHIRYGLAISERFGLHPSYSIYEAGFARQAAAMAVRFPILPKPIYRLMFSEGYTFGFPPKLYGLNAYLSLLEDVAPGMPWMVAGLLVDIRTLIEPAIERGGHVRVGLEDAPGLSERNNIWWVENAVKAIELAGGSLANAKQVRTKLKEEING